MQFFRTFMIYMFILTHTHIISLFLLRIHCSYYSAVDYLVLVLEAFKPWTQRCFGSHTINPILLYLLLIQLLFYTLTTTIKIRCCFSVIQLYLPVPIFLSLDCLHFVIACERLLTAYFNFYKFPCTSFGHFNTLLCSSKIGNSDEWFKHFILPSYHHTILTVSSIPFFVIFLQLTIHNINCYFFCRYHGCSSIN